MEMIQGAVAYFRRLTGVCAHMAAIAGLALCCLLAAVMVPAAPSVLGGSAAAQSAEAQRLVGNYAVRGRNPDGSRYAGTARISLTGNTVVIDWQISGERFQGTGALVQNILTVDWGDADPVVYRVNRDGTLSGVWAGGTATDNLTPVR